MGVQVYDVEVDVAIARPPTPKNTRTIFTRVAVSLDLSNFAADTEAKLIASQIAACHPHVVMPIATRITRLTL
jgi:hypothetical protein